MTFIWRFGFVHARTSKVSNMGVASYSCASLKRSLVPVCRGVRIFLSARRALTTHPLLAPLQDTAGQEQFARLTSFYARDAAAAVLAYDLTDRQSFEDIPKWYNYVIESRRNNKEQADCVVILAGAPPGLTSQAGKCRSKRNIPRNLPATRFFSSFSSPLQHANRT